MNAISSQLFPDSGTATSIYVIFYSDRKMRLRGKKFREGISDQKEREEKIAFHNLKILCNQPFSIWDFKLPTKRHGSIGSVFKAFSVVSSQEVAFSARD